MSILNLLSEYSWIFYVIIQGILGGIFGYYLGRTHRKKVKQNKGFTLIELMIIIAIIGVIASLVLTTSCINNRGATEERAMEGARKFIKNNNLQISRITCAGDSNNDGYGTCTIVIAKTNERIRLKCPTNWVDLNVWGASSCKEVFIDMNLVPRQHLTPADAMD